MWQKIERARTVLQIVVAVLTLGGALSIWLKFSMPGWLGVVLFGVGVGSGLYSL